jgi:hypothetical protein
VALQVEQRLARDERSELGALDGQSGFSPRRKPSRS